MAMFERLWERHRNPWSWVARPVFGAILLWGAWVNSVILVAMSIIGLATSWFWFPRPRRVYPRIERFIDIERRFVTPPWTARKVASAAFVLGFIALVTAALWLKHAVLGLSLFMAGALAKSAWSIAVAGRSGVPAAVIGAISAACAGVVLWIVVVRG